MTPFTTVFSGFVEARGPVVGASTLTQPSSQPFIPAVTTAPHTSLRLPHAHASHIHPHSLTITTTHSQQAVSPQEWQGIVASGAMPVRQALHSYIASSRDKPPASKEEAQAVLEEMFRLRAEKVRRAIEQGKLATTEALRLRVCQRRESVMSEGNDTHNMYSLLTHGAIMHTSHHSLVNVLLASFLMGATQRNSLVCGEKKESSSPSLSLSLFLPPSLPPSLSDHSLPEHQRIPSRSRKCITSMFAVVPRLDNDDDVQTDLLLLCLPPF